jgi:hypothetical protein
VGMAQNEGNRTAVIVASYDPGYLRILEHQVRQELALNRVPLVFDITSLSAAPVDSYDRVTLKALRLPYPGYDIRSRMEVLGAEYLVPVNRAANQSELLDEPLEDTLAIAVQSALISYFRTDRPDRSKRAVGQIAKRLAAEGRSTFTEVGDLLARHSEIDRILLPNGRYPGQKMAAQAAERAGIRASHFEKGETPNGTYLQDYAPQNRLRSQASVDPVLAGLTDQEIDKIASRWLSRRAPSRNSSNEFSALWKQGLPADLATRLESGTKVVGFFTSSQDEFQFLGPEWQLHDWSDQFEAFDRMLVEVEQAGFIAYLRVHPNLATKAQDCFVRERAGIRRLAQRHPGLLVIWHDESVSTYSLLDATNAVVVWDSTVGLEASARGLPVWTAATSRYGLVADVQERLSRNDVDSLGLKLWDVDRHAANRFIAYLVLRDEQMAEDYESWLPWNPVKPPLTTKLAAAMVSGGTPYRREALKSVIDVYRHRSMKSNLSHLRRR